jgi:hypothetical protein
VICIIALPSNLCRQVFSRLKSNQFCVRICLLEIQSPGIELIRSVSLKPLPIDSNNSLDFHNVFWIFLLKLSSEGFHSFEKRTSITASKQWQSLIENADRPLDFDSQLHFLGFFIERTDQFTREFANFDFAER